eukprot:PhF_6_TR26618/c0_g1_i1/m.38522
MTESMYVLLVAGDLYGAKHNIEIGFPGHPTYEDLIGHCESVFNNESRRLKPENTKLHRFIVDSIKVYDDRLNRWLDLGEIGSTIPEWSQLYLYQPEGRQDDNQDILPPPVRIRSPIEEGNNKERAFFLFHDMDFNGNGYVNREEFQRIFNVLCLFQYSEKQVDEWFLSFDVNRDQVLSVAEFAKYVTNHGQVMDELLQRSDEYWIAVRRKPNYVDVAYDMTPDARSTIQSYLERFHAGVYEKDYLIREEVMRRHHELAARGLK